ncbi:MAG: CBS domain-containing protein [Caldisphaera sp.]
MRSLISYSLSEIKNQIIYYIIDKNRPVGYPDDSATNIRKVIRDTGARIIPIIDRGNKKLLGIIDRGDILLISSTKTNATASSIMISPRITLNENENVIDSLNSIIKYDEWDVPIVNNNVYIGLLSIGDIIKLLITKTESMLKKEVAENYMTKNPITVKEDDHISKIWNKMIELKYAGFPVVNEKLRLLGIITQFDLIKKGYTRIHLESESGTSKGPRVRDAMSYTVRYAYPWSSLHEISKIMLDFGYGRIPIVENENDKKVIGIIDREDVAKILIKR